MHNVHEFLCNVKLCMPSMKKSVILQLLVVLHASLLSLNCGLNFGWPSPSVLDLLSESSEFEIDYDYTSYVVMLAPFAVCIGSPIGGVLMNKIGRKYTLLFLAVLQILSWICVAASSYVVMLIAGRILAGMSDGILMTSLVVYVCEILQPKIRGYIGSLPTVSICLGALFVNIYGSFVPVRLSAYISLSFPSLFIIFFVSIPESPYYLLMHDRSDDARNALKKLRSSEEVESELSKITIDIQRQIAEPGTIKEVFTIKSNLRAFVILLGVRTIQQFSGASAFSFYTHFIFKRAGGEISPATSSIICSTVKLLAVFLGLILVEKCGRRSLLLWSSIGSGTVLTILGVYFYFFESLEKSSALMWVPIVMMLAYFLLNSIGLITVPNLIMGELLPVKIKGLVLSFVNISGGISAGISSKLLQFLDRRFGIYSPFLTFAVFCFIGFVVIYICVPETKGKSLEEIQQILKRKKFRNVDTTSVHYTTKL
ncbi:hypothetical protein FQR65_LT09445 [Abscondita terminalis]|nr:hypothetical protein FQR65_LT09445 [Abscondita terminalis]